MKTSDNSSENSPTDSSAIVKKQSHPFWKFFWLSFLVASLAYAWYSFYAPSNDVVWAENMAAAQEIASDSDKEMMLFFTGKWCSPCQIMKREVFADEEVMKVINSQVVPVIIDVDNPNAAEIVKRYNAGMTPITIFTNHQGEVIDYATGKIDKTQFLEMLENLDAAGS